MQWQLAVSCQWTPRLIRVRVYEEELRRVNTPSALLLFRAAGSLLSTAYLPIWHSYDGCCDMSGMCTSGKHSMAICAALWR